MKKILWTAAMSLTVAACITACDESSSGSSDNASIPEYKNESALPDSCEMEIAKAGDSYFACLDNKWVEVTDSATVEKIKEGLDVDKLKEELEKLAPAPSTKTDPKPESSATPESSEASKSDDNPESSSSEACTGRRCKNDSSSSSEESANSGNGDSGSSGSDSGSSGDVSSESTGSSASVGSSTSVESSASAGSSTSLNRDARFSLLDDYIDWDENGTTGKLKDGVAPEDLYSVLNEGEFYSYNVGSASFTLDIAERLVGDYGSNVTVGLGDLFSGKLVYSATDSVGLTIIVSDASPNNSVFTDVVPIGKCGSKEYYKRTQFCDGRDGTAYKKVKIGTQTWMAQNLNYKTDKPSFCNDETKEDCGTYGLFYTWAASVGKTEEECGYEHVCNLGTGHIQGLCPKGWHMPNVEEWKTLIMYIDHTVTEWANNSHKDNSAGKALKSKTGWYENGNGTDAYGFSVWPAGYGYADYYDPEDEDKYVIVLDFNTECAEFWIAAQEEEDPDEEAYLMNFCAWADDAYLGIGNKQNTRSVRCVMD